MREKASITVYFSLIIMVLLAVIMTTVESARLAGVRVRCQSAAALGLESLFADYAAPLFEEYGLLFLEGSYGTGDRETYLNQYKDYVTYNIDCNYKNVFWGGDFYRSDLINVEAESIIYATDQDGKALEKQICEAMIGEIPINFLEKVIGWLELSNQCEILTKFFHGINSISDQVSRVDKAVQKIYEKVEELKKFQMDFEEEAERLRNLIDDLDSAWRSYESADTEEEEENAWDDVRYYEKKIQNLQKEVLKKQEQMQKLVKEAVKQEEIYKEKTQEVAEKLIKLERELLGEQEEEVKTEIAEVIKKQTADIKRFSGGKEDIYQVEAAEIPLQNCKNILEEGIQAIKASGLDENQFLAVLESQNHSLNEWKIAELEILFDNCYQGKTESGIVKIIKELINQGMIGFIMKGREISSVSLEKEELPSEKYGKETKTLEILKGLFCTENLAGEVFEAGKNSLLTDEYVLQYFTNVMEEKEHVLAYEAEYVLCGEMSDRKNLEGTIQQMVLLRTGMNIIYLLSDTESCLQVQAIAIGIIGFTGMMGLVRIVQLLLLAAWGYVEALLDVRNLVQGGKVAFLKNKSNWKSNIYELGNLEKLGNSATEDVGGLGYRDYLHILMIKEQQNRKLYRVMDLIQVNLCENGWEGFCMDCCIYGLQIKTDFLAKVLFLNICPFTYLGEIEGYSVQTIQGRTYE